MLETLIVEGLMIMLIGIFFVMAFLCILVFSMEIMSKVVTYLNKIFPEQVYVVEKPSKKASDDEAIAVALAVIKARA